MAPVTGGQGVVLDCADPTALADFHTRLTGWAIVHADADWVTIADRADAQPTLSFPRRPTITQAADNVPPSDSS